MKKIFFTFFLIATIFVSLAASAKPIHTIKHQDAISGFWYTQDRDGGVQLYHCGDKICGRFYWFKPNKKENVAIDSHNPDPEKKDRELCLMQFMGDFEADGKGHYNDGWIYSPRHGQTFSAEMTLVDHNTLNLRGYVLTPAFGEDQTWKRAKKMPSCAGHT